MSAYEAVKVQLDPTPRQRRLLCSHAGAARFAYNAGLAHVKDMLENGEPRQSGRIMRCAVGGARTKTF